MRLLAKWDKFSQRQFIHLDFCVQSSNNIRHISGQGNVVADAQSRVESVTDPPYYDAQAASQDDDELRKLVASTTALRLEKLPIPGTMVAMYCDTSVGRSRSYIPPPLRLQMFQCVHDLSRPGTKETAKRVAQCFVWPGVQKDLRTWERACQRSKVSRHAVTPNTNRIWKEHHNKNF